MKINHIGLNSSSWASYWDRKNNESMSNIYELRIYRYKEYSYYGYRYQLVSHSNKRYLYHNILNTDSKEEMKITLDLMGLRIKQVDIFIMENLNGSITVQFSVIDLIDLIEK